jgi:hypothetical protein
MIPTPTLLQKFVSLLSRFRPEDHTVPKKECVAFVYVFSLLGEWPESIGAKPALSITFLACYENGTRARQPGLFFNY